MQILAHDASSGDGGADRLFVAIHFRGVDMPVAETERAFDRRAAGMPCKRNVPSPSRGRLMPWLQMLHDNS